MRSCTLAIRPALTCASLFLARSAGFSAFSPLSTERGMSTRGASSAKAGDEGVTEPPLLPRSSSRNGSAKESAAAASNGKAKGSGAAAASSAAKSHSSQDTNGKRSRYFGNDGEKEEEVAAPKKAAPRRAKKGNCATITAAAASSGGEASVPDAVHIAAVEGQAGVAASPVAAAGVGDAAAADAVLAASQRLHAKLLPTRWRGTSQMPISVTYNVFAYAFDPWSNYVRTFAGTGRVLFLGMNPGPFGMAQTGVPFGEVQAVTGWLGISGQVGQPVQLHAKRPVDGFSCSRSEVSGRRLWGFFSRRFGSSQEWAERAFVLNWCPLAFMSKSGANVTPDKLSVAERQLLEKACDDALEETVRALSPRLLVGVGKFAGDKLKAVAARVGHELPTAVVVHPSPAGPKGRMWETATTFDQLVLETQSEITDLESFFA